MFSSSSFNCTKSPILDYYKETKNCNVIKIDKKIGLSYEFMNYSLKWEKAVSFSLNNNFIGFKMEAVTIGNCDISEIFDQILSTFKFIAPE